MEKRKTYTGRILLTILFFSIVLVLFIVGIVNSIMMLHLRSVCTSEAAGVVREITTGFVKSIDRTEIRFLDEGENKQVMHIAVDPASGFGKECIYANPGRDDKVGTEVTIHFSPDDPYDHYINSWLGTYKKTGIFTLATGAAALLSFLLLLKLNRANKAEKQKNTRRNMIFDSPYCRFYFEYSGDVGYEGDVEWEFNKSGEKKCLVYFDTDVLPSESREDFLEMTRAILYGESDDRDITQLAADTPQLMSVAPGECYKRLQKYLYDKERTDLMIRKTVADYFLFKPELIKEGSTEQELMDGLELSFIGSYRNGNIEFSIYFSQNIYTDDLRVVIKPDDSKEIRYNTDDSRYTGEEICDEV